jgi:V8-like Glu-specific endopeptidase
MRLRRSLGVCAVVMALALLLGVLADGCSGPRAGRPGHHPAGRIGALAFWDRAQLLAALPYGLASSRVPRPGQTASPHTAAAGSALRVGALFERGASGNHFCTASVVASPGKDMLITAAHCINGGRDSSGYLSDIVFIPGYRDGQEPYGVWTVARLLVAPQWADSSDPDYDVGFVVLQPHNGENIEQVLGANQLGTDDGYRYLVHVTGYPDSANSPITCVNWTSRQSATQLKFACQGYTGGTSGSPWVSRFNTRSRTGTIVGVIGGYQEGGDSPSVSYSVHLDPGIRQLYQQAAALPTSTPTSTPASTPATAAPSSPAASSTG